MGRACLLLGRLDEARRLGNRAVESSRHQPGFTAHALRLLGDIATHPDRFDAESGEAHYREALGAAQTHGCARSPPTAISASANSTARIGETELAREKITSATAMYREMDMGVSRA